MKLALTVTSVHAASLKSDRITGDPLVYALVCLGAAAVVLSIAFQTARRTPHTAPAGNILVRRPPPASSSGGPPAGALARLQERQVELLPIDHGFCLPEAPESPYFEWLYWPQVRGSA